MTTVAISVVSTAELSRLEPCLRSLDAQDFDGSLEVVVVCNGPPDDSGRIAQTHPGASTIFNAHRKGFAENHNHALAATSAEYGLILNPDVVLDTACIRELVAAMEAHPGAGMIGPLLRYPDGAAQQSARRFPRPLGTVVRRTPLRALAGSRLRQSRHFLPPPSSDRMVDWLLGACLMVRMSAWRSIGGFDPGFRPLYVEDIDLAWRMWAAGWEVWQSPSAEAMHEHQAATDKQFLDRRTLWHLRGMLRFVRKHPRILVSGARPTFSQQTNRGAASPG